MTCYEQAEYFGIENRLIKLSEECGELVRAALKYYEVLQFNNRDKGQYLAEIEEEMADVLLLMQEVRYLLNIHGHDLDEIMKFKIDRTDKIIKDFNKSGDDNGGVISLESLESMLEQLKPRMHTIYDVDEINKFKEYVRSFVNGEFSKSSETL